MIRTLCYVITLLVSLCPNLSVSGQDSPIVRENRLPGSTDWQLTRVRVDADGFRSPWIEGYCSRQSV